MGSITSRVSPAADNPHSPERPSRLLPYLIYPPEVKILPGEDFYYTDFCEKAYATHHINGENIIIMWPHDEHQMEMERPNEVEGWAVINLRKVYEHLGEDHPRIVQYVYQHFEMKTHT